MSSNETDVVTTFTSVNNLVPKLPEDARVSMHGSCTTQTDDAT